MPSRPRFTQADVTRAIKAVTQMGLTPTRIEIDRNGTIALFFNDQPLSHEDIEQYIGPIVKPKRSARGI